MNKLKVFSENGEEHQPVRSTKYAAAYDLRAARDFILKPCSLVHMHLFRLSPSMYLKTLEITFEYGDFAISRFKCIM